MRRWAADAGQSMVEFALTSTLFFLIVLFVADGGRILWQRQVLAQATASTARYAAYHGALSAANGHDSVAPGENAKLKTVALASVTGLTASKLSVSGTWSPSNNNKGSVVTVSSTYTATTIVTAIWPSGQIVMRETSSMVVQF